MLPEACAGIPAKPRAGVRKTRRTTLPKDACALCLPRNCGTGRRDAAQNRDLKPYLKNGGAPTLLPKNGRNRGWGTVGIEVRCSFSPGN